jgi:hypothetical protein
MYDVTPFPYWYCEREGLVTWRTQMCGSMVSHSSPTTPTPGSPLICRDALTALHHATTSHVSPEGRMDVYTRLLDYLSWIRGSVEDLPLAVNRLLLLVLEFKNLVNKTKNELTQYNINEMLSGILNTYIHNVLLTMYHQIKLKRTKQWSDRTTRE